LNDTPSFSAHVRLVAGREIRERGGSRSFKASTLVTLVLVLGLVLIPASLSDDGPEEWSVAVSGTASPAFAPALDAAASTCDASTEVVTLPAGAAPDDALDSYDAVLVDGRVITDGEIGGGLRSAVSSAWAQSQVLDGLSAAGLDEQEAMSALQFEPIEFTTLEGDVEADEDASAKETAAFIGVVALFIAINSYGAWVLTGVLEEKSSRVVEVIISAVPPRALLAGKVSGIGLLGLGQLVVVGAAGLIAAVAAGITEVPLALVPAVGSIIVWFILGFAFYAVGYAAAGSLVSRQEDAQSAATPLAMLVLGAYFVSLLVVSPNPESVAAMICSFIPFTAPLAMPARIAQDAAAPWEIVVSITSMLVGTWLMVRLAARVYERSLLSTGAPIRLWTALREARTSGRATDAVSQ
jgi:ABC-2 type transport system permease protein